jgi:hypothetical protein
MLKADFFFKFKMIILPPLWFLPHREAPTLAPLPPVRRRIEANGVGKSGLKVSDLQHKRN